MRGLGEVQRIQWPIYTYSQSAARSLWDGMAGNTAKISATHVAADYSRVMIPGHAINSAPFSLPMTL